VHSSVRRRTVFTPRDEEMSTAKHCIYGVLEQMKPDGLPRFSRRLRGDTKRKLECDDILNFLPLLMDKRSSCQYLLPQNLIVFVNCFSRQCRCLCTFCCHDDDGRVLCIRLNTRSINMLTFGCYFSCSAGEHNELYSWLRRLCYQ